jgi:RimJ/RimL family protein N-acetyltransferase
MELETKRLLLRPLHDDDAHAMALALNNYAVAKNMARVAFPYSLEAAQHFINLQRSFDSRSKICAIAFRAAPDELLGLVSYEYAEKTGDYELGYWLRQCCWHMGIMSEAAMALVKYGFTLAHVQRLTSCYHVDNPHSGRILRKLGFGNDVPCTNSSLAQGKKVAVIKLNLTREMWLHHEKGRAS